MNRVNINPRGLEDVLRSSGTHRATLDVAERVADNVRAQGIRVGDKDGGAHEKDMPVEVTGSTTDDMRMDRAKASVTIAHPSGLAVQAKHGALTKAAGQAGLKVTEQKR